MDKLEKWKIQDVFICALRYALYRHTYVLSEICDAIKTSPEIQSNRVTSVMLNDIKQRLDDWDDTFASFETDRQTILDLQEWLLKLSDD